MIAVGCRNRNLPETIGNDTTSIDALMVHVDAGAPPRELPAIPAAPLTLKTPEALDTATYRDITLQETIEVALGNSEVLRDLGATVLRSPSLVATGQTLGIVETDPQASVEAALSAFDAQIFALGKWQNNESSIQQSILWRRIDGFPTRYP